MTMPESGSPTTVRAYDQEAARMALHAVSTQFARLLRETDDIERQAAGTDWTVAETAAHVAVVLLAFSAAVTGDGQEAAPDQHPGADFPTRLAATNAETIDMIDHDDAERLARLISSAAQRFSDVIGAADPQTECATPWYGPGRTRTVGCLTALALGELTVHGHDIAAGTDRPWAIPDEHANLIVGTVCPEMLPLLVRPDAASGASVTYDIRLRRGGPRLVFRVADGRAELRPTGNQADCVLCADPVAYLLVVYGRLSLAQAMARGAVTADGRRPWLGPGFANLFFTP